MSTEISEDRVWRLSLDHITEHTYAGFCRHPDSFAVVFIADRDNEGFLVWTLHGEEPQLSADLRAFGSDELRLILEVAGRKGFAWVWLADGEEEYDLFPVFNWRDDTPKGG